jgi:non-heme chloroperoxidase
MPYVRARDGTRLYYEDWGAGAPLVFIHGWGLGADMWEYQMPYLAARGLRCIAYDRRGCGRSDHPGDGYDFDTFADDLAALLDTLDVRAVTLVGHSMGGGEVARYLARHGAGRVARTVLLSSITPFLLQTADNPDGVDASVFDFIVAELEKDRPRYLAQSVPMFFGVGLPGVSVSPEMMAWGVGLALRASPKATIEMVRAFSRTDFRSDMPAFTVPTLIIHGDSDHTVPLEVSARKTAAAIPGSELRVYEGAAHGLFVSDKDRLNADLLAFARS